MGTGTQACSRMYTMDFGICRSGQEASKIALGTRQAERHPVLSPGRLESGS
jgi:hypothetical protein